MTLATVRNVRRLLATSALLAAGVLGCARVGLRVERVRPGRRASRPAADQASTFTGLVDAHNRERGKRGLAPLEPNDALNEAAQRHADGMAARRKMSHRGGDGSSPFRRMERAGYRYSSAAENVAMGQDDLGELMTDWMRSPGHRRNVLGRFTEIGTGYATDAGGTPYWCVTFGTPEGR